ncbi:type 2 isopentenyl-diphosphate Delta-isomerase [Sulfobacillus harzensis]|uniref:Isopentenyl-diphosphate delta-isomerase n=1 Tax=Sulfobacillus harzensis TaxID=2729629 RepID=A0A7Y0Q192_9FIRM|nr:type 2 isopentenyl-diphosphate Delta-isomerase [Sulfobacillus harzensis]NMP21080.1 type 2 isopentenyl-diphosphate Delta-isomerase [Sulfobacillus harzensis]
MGEVEDRERRKHEHIEAVQTLPDVGGSGFEDVRLLPVSAPQMDVADATLATELLGRSLSSPIIVNAMTGGTEESGQINARLARFAKRQGLAMAVGSETAGLRSPEAARSYAVVRELNPDGVIIANVGMGAGVDAAKRAVQLVGADFLQIHWNVAQELFMAEGDRHFRQLLERLAEVKAAVDVPVIAKEVGQGMTGPAARRFVEAGADAVDIGGVGGTNFIAVEAWRRGAGIDQEWLGWGVPTAASLGEVAAELQDVVPIIASGGIRSGHDVAKALAMGARAVGVAGPLMRIATGSDPDRGLDAWVDGIHWTMRTILVLMGARQPADLADQPILVMGRVGEWLDLRGYRPYRLKLAQRANH